MWAALGIVSALLERERTGEGAVVDTSLYETALGYIGYHLVGFLADGTVPTGAGNGFPMVAPYQVFPTRDGELMVAGGNDRLFAAALRRARAARARDDERFRTNPDRVRNREELVALVSDRLRERDTRRLARAADGGGRARPRRSRTSPTSPLPSRRMRSGFLQRVEHPAIPELRLPALPLSFDRERATHASAPPAVGEHTAEILEEVGYSPDEIAALARDGVIRTR